MADDPTADDEGRRLRAEFLQEMREIDARRAAVAARAVPLIELCRPIVDAAYMEFLRDPERWADGIIVNVERKLKNDVSFHVSESKEAIWNLAHLIAYFRSDNNPFTEALRHVDGTLPDRDKSDGVKRDPTGAYVQNLARYSRNGLGPAWVCGPFPEGTTREQAHIMLRRWYKLATGREFGETDNAKTLEVGNDNAAHKRRWTRDEADAELRWDAKRNPDDYRNPSPRKLSARTGIPESTIRSTDFYKRCQGEAKVYQRPKAEPLTDIVLDNEGHPDEALQELLGEHERDYEPSPLDGRNRPNPVEHKRL